VFSVKEVIIFKNTVANKDTDAYFYSKVRIKTIALPTYRRVGLLCVGFCGGMCGSAVFADAFFFIFLFYFYFFL
jgi:hypothetical protein